MPQVPISRMIEAALVAYPGTASRVDMPGRADRSAVIFVNPDQGEPRRVAVDPGTGRVLGSVVYDRTLVGWADAMHRSMLLGIFGERLVELAACWALVLLATGMILWWPRGAGAPAVHSGRACRGEDGAFGAICTARWVYGPAR